MLKPHVVPKLFLALAALWFVLGIAPLLFGRPARITEIGLAVVWLVIANGSARKLRNTRPAGTPPNTG